MMLDAMKVLQKTITSPLYKSNPWESLGIWMKNAGFTTILSFHPDRKDGDSPFGFMRGYPHTDNEIKERLKTSVDAFVIYIYQPEVINFFNDMYGRIDIHTTRTTGKKQRFVLKHAGPAARKSLQQWWLGKKYKNKDEKLTKRIWNRSLEGFSLEKYTKYTQKYSNYKNTKPGFGDFGETINVFGHTIFYEFIIKEQKDTCIRPLDVGSFMTGKVAMASLIAPDVEFIKSEKITAHNQIWGDYSYWLDKLKHLPQMLSHAIDALNNNNSLLPASTPINNINWPMDLYNKTLRLWQEGEFLYEQKDATFFNEEDESLYEEENRPLLYRKGPRSSY